MHLSLVQMHSSSRLAQVIDGNIEWFLGDALGSVRQLVDNDGNVVLSRDYGPYGQAIAESGDGSSGYGFTGEQYGAYTQLSYLRARWMDPKSGRFLSLDPWTGSIQHPNTLHKYAYGLNNPLVFMDPSGAMCIAGFDVGMPGCTDVQREQAARKIAFLGGFVSSPKFAEGFLLELVDTVGIGWISIGSGLFESQMEQLGLSELGGCGTYPLELLTPYSNLVNNPDPYFQTGRAAGRLTALILGLNEIGVGIGGSTAAVVASPFTFGVSLGAGTVTLSMSAHGAAVVGTVAVKEVADPLLTRLGDLVSAFAEGGSGGYPGTSRPGYSGPSQGWNNQKPSDLAPPRNAKKLEDALHDQDYQPPSGLIGADPKLKDTAKFNYVMDSEGNIWVQRGGHHPDLVNGQNAYGAGEMYIDQSGQIVWINDMSGHYRPQGSQFFPYLKNLLEQLGISPGTVSSNFP